ncbi:MAG: PorP/SprF family type IX secretion system membrane protein [Chitinophagaceae bacterium]|nr:PorP/SprF family type IX secretion system membrane protein [Chitinophagaceae bacterium]
MRWRKMISLVCLMATTFYVKGQDIHLSQFYQSPLLRNPALAGLFDGDIRVQGVYRDQWNSVTKAYRTGSLNAEYKLPVGQGDDYLTVGLQSYFDRAGTVSYTKLMFYPAINFHKSLSTERNMYISAGFMGGWVQHSIDLTKVTTNSTYEGMGINENITDPTYAYLDGSTGISFNTQIKDDPENNLYLGVAYHHFNRPENSFYRNKNIQLNPKWVFSGGLKLNVGEYSFVEIQGDHYNQGSFKQTILGAMYGLKIGPYPDEPDYTLSLGTFMRLQDALIPVLKLEYPPYAISFSYDANVSKLKPSSLGRGGFEMSISFTKKTERYSNPYAPRF